MSALAKFIERQNMFASMFGEEEAAMPTTKAECERWFLELESALSPENLYCDGEISHKQAMQKKRKLDAAWEELERIAGPREAIY